MENIKNKIKTIINVKVITKLVLFFIILQPIFDILSFLNIRGYIPVGISTIIKPLFVFGIGLIIYFIDKKQRKSYTKIFVGYGILILIHSIILKDIMVSNSVILHELRFMINIAYMLVMFMIMDYVYINNEDKTEFINKLKKTLVITFLIYTITIVLAVITGTSAKTYEYSDATKQGYKGWLDSGQIFGHALSITLPFMIYYLLKYDWKNKIINILSKVFIILPVGVLLLIGTKVTFFIALLVLMSHVILDGIYFIKKRQRKDLFSSIACLILLILSISIYPYLPVKKNIDINNNVLSVDMSGIEKGSETNRKDLIKMKENISKGESNANRTKFQDERLKRIEKYYMWDYKSSTLLENKYATGELHPSDMRARQLVYNLNKYKLSSIQYKLFGLGYLNQPEALSIERDIFMIIFSFGIIGFLTVLLKPMLIWLKSTFKILKNFKEIELDTLYLYEGLSISFCISIYAGYTFIYTNFSIFLVIIALLLRDSFRKYSKNSFNKYFDKIYKNGRTEFYSELEEKITNNEKQFIVTANPETLMQAEKDEELRKAVLDDKTVIIPDGVGIIKGADKLNYQIKETILGVDVANKLLELADKYNKNVFLFGAKKETIEKMQQVIKEKYSGCNLVGAIDGYVDNKDEVFEQMKEANPDVVLVALGIPNQEKLIYKNLNKFEKGIFVGVGGSFDVISGCKKRAPKIFIKLKLEWLYRITVEPSRLKRFYESNIKYLFKINNDVI